MLKHDEKQLVLEPFIVAHDDRREKKKARRNAPKSRRKSAKNLSAHEVIVRVVERVKRI